MKRYRYRKITPDILKKMKKLRKQGLTYKEIGNKIGVTMSTALYHLSPRERENRINSKNSTWISIIITKDNTTIILNFLFIFISRLFKRNIKDIAKLHPQKKCMGMSKKGKLTYIFCLYKRKCSKRISIGKIVILNKYFIFIFSPLIYTKLKYTYLAYFHFLNLINYVLSLLS